MERDGVSFVEELTLLLFFFQRSEAGEHLDEPIPRVCFERSPAVESALSRIEDFKLV